MDKNRGLSYSRARGGGRTRRAGRTRGRGLSARRIAFEVLEAQDETTSVASTITSDPEANPRFSLSEELKKIKKRKALDKKNEKSLSAEQRSRLLMLREQKQIGRFLMPDAPERKQKRKSSPPRGPCPLIPGTPETPPPREFQAWKKLITEAPASTVVPSVAPQPTRYSPEPGSLDVDVTSTMESSLQNPIRYSPQPGPSGLRPMRHPEPVPSDVNVASTMDSSEDEALSKELEVTPQRKKRKQILFSPSMGVLTIDQLTDDVHIVNSDIELVGFTPESSVRGTSSLSTPVQAAIVDEIRTVMEGSPETILSPLHVSDVNLFDNDFEQQLLQWEQNVQGDVGSDVYDDDIDDFVDFSESSRRNASEFPANIEEVLPANVLSELTALDAQDDSALKSVATDAMLQFNWCNDRDFFTGQREVFTAQAGPTFSTESLSPSDIFLKIWDADIIDEIVRETNRYAKNLVNDPTLPRYTRMRKWVDVTREELWVFFSIMMLQSIVPLPVEKEYWYPNLPYLKLGNFSDFMPYSRFLLLKKCLHFVDNNNFSQVPNEDKKLQKIRPIIDHLNEKFSSLYQPEQDIAIDESLLLWKGRLSFAQLISNKAAKFGIKSYELCESKSGYLWKIIIYTGKKKEPEQQESVEDPNEPESATSKIVFNLVRPLLDKGYTLVMDNFYNSPLLSRMLKARKTDTMGTLRVNRQFVPESLRNKSKTNMRTGEVAFSQTKDISIVLWKDVNVVALISTYHKMEVGGKKKHGAYKYKPAIVLDYNLSMGGVDKKDQMLQAFPIERVRNTVWYKKLFRRLFNVSIHNTFVLFSYKNKILHRQFRLQLVDELLKKFHLFKANPHKLPLKSDHFPLKVTVGRPRCKLCATQKLDTRTQWKCDTCDVSLCLIGCFKDYHVNIHNTQ